MIPLLIWRHHFSPRWSTFHVMGINKLYAKHNRSIVPAIGSLALAGVLPITSSALGSLPNLLVSLDISWIRATSAGMKIYICYSVKLVAVDEAVLPSSALPSAFTAIQFVALIVGGPTSVVMARLIRRRQQPTASSKAVRIHILLV